MSVDLSILVMGLDRAADGEAVMADVRRQVDALGVASELIAVPASRGDVGAALRSALPDTHGDYVITMDVDIAPPFTFVGDLWSRRRDADIVVASRYVQPAAHAMTPVRAVSSNVLNAVFGRGLALGIRDASSSFRIHRADVLKSLPLEARGYDVLQEVLVRARIAGWSVQEIPFVYRPNPAVRTKVHGTLAAAYVRTFWSMWKLRNSIAAADYDFRAHDSVIPLQRAWQRQRFRHVTDLIAGQGAVLDVGCGSSHIIGMLPRGSVALDILMNKLRFARRFGVPLVRGSGFALPFPDEAFPCVLSSQVIEHVPMEPSMIDELCRVLQPGGRLVLGTPDYSRREWVWIEKLYGFFAPGGYADEHISHYTRASLLELFARKGYALEATRYVFRGELILAFRKPRRA